MSILGIPNVLPTYPPPPLPPPTSGVACTIAWRLPAGSAGAGSASAVNITIMRRRLRAVAWPIRRAWEPPLVNLVNSDPWPTVTRVVIEEGETIALRPGDTVPLFTDDLRGFTYEAWLWFKLAPNALGIVVPPVGGADVIMGGSLDEFGAPRFGGAGLVVSP
jgi:hypothetical protein